MGIGRCYHREGGRLRGFTLLEVLLTLSLLVILSALAWPALDRPFANIRLRKAAELIRGAWTNARVKAIDSGETYIFRCILQAGDFTTEAYSTATGGAYSTMGQPTGLDSGALGALPVPTEGVLSDDIVFLLSETAMDTQSLMVILGVEEGALRDTGWSDPIPFYPDGTTADARLVLVNKDDLCIEVTLRGLTGAVTIGEVFFAEEITR